MSNKITAAKAYSIFKKLVHKLNLPLDTTLNVRQNKFYDFKTEIDPSTIYNAAIECVPGQGYRIWGGIELQTKLLDDIKTHIKYLTLLTESGGRSSDIQELSWKLRTTNDEDNFKRITETLVKDIQSQIDGFPVIRSMEEYLEFMLPYFEIPAEECFEVFSTKEHRQAKLPGDRNLEVRFGSKYFYGTVALCAWLAELLQHDVARQRQRLFDVLHLPVPTIPEGITNKEAFQIADIFGSDRQEFINRIAPIFKFEPFKCPSIDGLPMLRQNTSKELFTGFDKFLGLGVPMV